MPVKAVLFDLGGTLWDDYPMELEHWRWLADALQAAGRSVTLQHFIDLVPQVVTSYCPSLTRGILYQLVSGEPRLYSSLLQGLSTHMEALLTQPDEFRRLNVLYSAARAVLDRLAARYRLAIVSQHSQSMRGWLSHYGLQDCFEEITLTGEGLCKPDPRLYLNTLSALGVAAEEAVMVGDRLDNDIWPANYLGIRTVRILSNPYRLQQPRYHLDEPVITLSQLRDLPDAI